MPEADGIYEVEKVIRHRWTGEQLEFLVNWKGFGHKFNTWQAEDTLTKARKVVRDYWRSKRPQKRTKATTAKAVETRPAAQKTQGKIVTRAAIQKAPPATSARRSSRLAKTLSTSAPVSHLATRQKRQPHETTMVMDTASIEKAKKPEVVPEISPQPEQSLQASLQPGSHDRLVNRKRHTRLAKLEINNNISTGRETEGDGKDMIDGDDDSERLRAVKQEQGVLISPTRSTGPDIPNIVQFKGQDLYICNGFRQGWNWDEEVALIEKAKIRKVNGAYTFYLVVRWKDGTLSAHESNEVASKCAKKVLDFYENQIMACYQ